MAAIAALGLVVAGGWSISVGGWFAVMMIAMAVFCAAGMLFMWLTAGRPGFMCGMWSRDDWNASTFGPADDAPRPHESERSQR